MSHYDIVIPVHNGLDFFRPCLESVLQHAPVEHRILIVDDASSEPALLDYLSRVADGARILLLRNEENLGFIGSVNRGMAFSDRDVVLLNSDTVVTPNWLEKMDRAAASDPAVGTVTPWTNNGTICSFPHFCADNSLPEGWDAEKLSALSETVCPGWYPHLPTAVGFCMLIKRAVLKRVGLFDAETFGRGYGEENEFCMRATEAGFVHLLDDRTFVEHKGSLSFGAERSPTVAANLVRLRAMVPRYDRLVGRFVADDALFSLRRRMERVIEHDAGRRHVLLVLPGDPFAMAGTELHVRTLARELRRDGRYLPHLLANDGNVLSLWEPRGEDDWVQHEQVLRHEIEPTTQWSEAYFQALREIVAIFHIDLAHVHHLLNHPLQLPAMLRQLRVPVFLTAHDYHLACISHNLIDADGTYCGTRRQNRDCDDCMRRRDGYGAGFWQRRHEAVQDWLGQLAGVFAPSAAAAAEIAAEFPGLAGKVQVVSHGVEATASAPVERTSPQEPLRVAFIGNLAPNKGSAMIAEIIGSRLPGVEWHLVGKLVDERLQSLGSPSVVLHGAYAPEALSERLAGIRPHLAVFCSPWPETYCYALTEAWQAGCPALVGPLGAPAERVAATGAGWVVQKLTVASYTTAIARLRDDPNEWRRGRERVVTVVLDTPVAMAVAYIDAYSAVALDDAGARLEAATMNWLVPRTDHPTRKATEAERELLQIKHSGKWRLLERIDRHPLARWLVRTYRELRS